MRIEFRDNETDVLYDTWASYYNGELDLWEANEPKYVPNRGDFVRLNRLSDMKKIESVSWLSQESVICYVE